MDASRYFTEAKHLELYGIHYFLAEWGKGIQAWTDAPVVPFLYGLIFKVFGEARVFIQVFNSLLFSLTAVLVYLIGKTLWDEETGLLGGWLLLGMPYLITQVPLMLVDVPTMFFFTLSVYAFLILMERGGLPGAVFSGVTLFLAFFSKYSVALMLSIIPVTLAVWLFKAEKAARRELILKRAVPAFLIFAALAGALAAYKYGALRAQMEVLKTYQLPGLGRWQEGFFSTGLFQIHPAITLAALSSFYFAAKKRDLSFLIVSWLALLIIVLGIKRIRYLIPAFPFFSLMAAYAMARVRYEGVRRFLAASAIVTSFVISVFGYRAFLENISLENLAQAGRYMDGLHSAVVDVYTLPALSEVNPAVAVPILDLYTSKRLHYKYRPPVIPPEAAKSALRFTWEYKNPRYYEENALPMDARPVVLISGDPGEPIPQEIKERLKEYRKDADFNRQAGIFRFKTFVSVYLPSGEHFMTR